MSPSRATAAPGCARVNAASAASVAAVKTVSRKYGNMGSMKTTLEIPDLLFRKAKAKAAERGQTLKQLVTEALQEKLAVNTGKARPGEPEWMEGFGKLRRLRKETRRIQARIDERFEVIEPEDRA